VKTPDFLDLLQQRASEAGLSVPQGVADSLAAYFELLAYWNQKVNLVGFPLDEPSPPR